MTISLPADAFEPARRLPHFRAPRPVKSRRARAVSVGITIAAHLLVTAALVYGIGAAHTPKVEQPIFVEMVKEQKKPDLAPVPPPRFAPPAMAEMAPPMIDIAPPPPPNAITTVVPKPNVPPAPPVTAAPVPAEPPAWNGQVSYYASLLTWLERFKQYPAAARAAHIEGQVFVHFVMTRDGTVTFSEIAKSSGRPALDREALAMMQRAGKLPPMPEQMKGETLNGVIGPITFKLN